MSQVHISPYAGDWYPENAAELEALLDGCFERSRGRTGPFLFPNALGFVTPHAGPAYSGTVAAAVYRAIRDRRPERVVVLGFPHRGGLDGVAAPDVDTIATPLGEVPLDAPFGGFGPAPEARLCDHSFEIQLPFLQRACPSTRISGLYVGRMNADERAAAADALAAAWRPGTVFVASSDFTHYGRNFGYVPFPPDRMVASRLRDLDFECIEAAGTLRADVFLETLAARSAPVCGSAPIALLIETLRRLGSGDVYASTLDYQTSGELTGDYRHSVSYAALGFCPASSFELSAPDREALLDSAEQTLRNLRETGRREPRPARSGSPALGVRRGSFVTLHQGDELLGCVGNCSGHASLADDVANLTLAAALDDPRFSPAAEVSGPIDIEISVLTPFRRIRATDDFHAGRHGAFLRLGRHDGLLLPQVATHYGWDAEQFLKALARKSGLGPQACADPKARLYVFEAQVFSRRGRAAAASA
jgi:AmmeMemoRadiSam system protein B/AmmeMemoRadiSam system protein A